MICSRKPPRLSARIITWLSLRDLPVGVTQKPAGAYFLDSPHLVTSELINRSPDADLFPRQPASLSKIQDGGRIYHTTYLFFWVVFSSLCAIIKEISAIRKCKISG